MDRNRGSQDPNPERSPFGGQRPSRLSPSAFVWILLLGLIVFWVWGQFATTGGGVVRIPYSTFRAQVQAGNVSEVTMRGDELRGTLKQPLPVPVGEGQGTFTDFLTYLPSTGDDQLLPLLEAQGVTVQTLPASTFSFWSLLGSLLPLVLLGVLAFYFLRRMRVQGEDVLSMGKSRAKRFDRKNEATTFEDVAGAHGAKAELQEVVSFLKDPTRFHRLGAETPKGVLLVGPPGTGKTLLARAVAGEAGVPFFSITGSDFMEMFVGVGASRVRDMFAEAKKAAPSIIFIDELDSVGRRRGAGLGGGHDEREQTLNQLLSELDGFEPNENVIVMAATNRVDILDPALLRPGRFDRHINVDLPTMLDRWEILKVHARGKPFAPDVDLEEIAKVTPGFSGADLRNVLNEAALLAARRDQDQITQRDISESLDKVQLGLERENLALGKEELRLVAYHEAGHTLVAAVLPYTDPVHKVTIIPRGRAMGVTQQVPQRDKYIFPREYMLDRLAVMMGGRAAEKLALNTSTSGAENDLKEATKLARRMVLDWGMSDSLEHIAYGQEQTEVFLGETLAQGRDYSDLTAREVDQEVKEILDEAYARAHNVLEEHRGALDRLVEVLLKKEEVLGDEVLALLHEEGASIPAEKSSEPAPAWSQQPQSAPDRHAPSL